MNRDDSSKQELKLTPVTDPQGYCPIRSTLAWFHTAGQFDGQGVNIRQVAFYTGMQMEELAEKLAIFLGKTDDTVVVLQYMGHQFKSGVYDTAVGFAMQDEKNAEEILDGDLDQIWVSIGSAGAQGADVAGGYREVGRANWDKFPNGVVCRDEVTGKVIKPEGWMPPNLQPFLFHNRKH